MLLLHLLVASLGLKVPIHLKSISETDLAHLLNSVNEVSRFNCLLSEVLTLYKSGRRVLEWRGMHRNISLMLR